MEAVIRHSLIPRNGPIHGSAPPSTLGMAASSVEAPIPGLQQRDGTGTGMRGV